MNHAKIYIVPDPSIQNRQCQKKKTALLLFLIIFGVFYGFGSKFAVSDGLPRVSTNELLDSPSSIFGITKEPKGSSDSNLNVTLDLNQSAYLPGSRINATYSIQNNYTDNLESIQYTLNISDMILVTGDLNGSVPLLGVNETYNRSVILELPENNQSLDVVFLIDSSGSMGEELAEVKTEISSLIATLTEQVSRLRIGFVMFGSTEYAENPYEDSRNILDFTDDVGQIETFISVFNAEGSWEPWGDALHYLKEMSWESSARLAILITDESCNPGYYIGDSEGDTSYYYGEDLYGLVEELYEINIIVGTMQCYGGGYPLIEQLQRIASIGNGEYVMLSASSSELMQEAISMCEDVIAETGQKLSANTVAMFNGSAIENEIYRWILVDNNPPGITPSIHPIFISSENGIEIRYKMICTVYDASGVDEIELFYKFNTTEFIQTPMNKTESGAFSFMFPSITEGSILTYYFAAEDRLSNNVTTPMSVFVINYEEGGLEHGNSYSIELAYQEMALFRVNSTKDSDSLLTISANGLVAFNLVDEADGTVLYSQIFNITHSFVSLALSDYRGNNRVIITGLSTLQDSQVSLAINNIAANLTISPTTIESTLDTTVEYNNPIFLRVNIEPGEYTNFYCQIQSQSEFTFYQLKVFNEENLLKSQIFSAISVPINGSGLYYLMIVQKDSRNYPQEIVITVALGEFDDTPYWHYEGYDGSGDVAIPSFPLWALMVFSAIALVFLMKLKKREK